MRRLVNCLCGRGTSHLRVRAIGRPQRQAAACGELAVLARSAPMPVKVNLIAWNPGPGIPYSTPEAGPDDRLSAAAHRARRSRIPAAAAGQRHLRRRGQLKRTVNREKLPTNYPPRIPNSPSLLTGLRCRLRAEGLRISDRPVTPNRRHSLCNPIRGVANHIAFGGKVPGDQRTPSASIASMSGTMGEAPSPA